MSKRTDTGGQVAPAQSESIWPGAATVRRVHALNERCIESMASLARSDREQVSLVVVSQHRTLWRGLNAVARKHAAEVPFLLMDVHFQDAHWWRAAQSNKSRRPARALTAAFSGKIASGLMRETLMLAWSTVLLGRGTASVLFGMAPAVADIVAELGSQDIERISAKYSRSLRPRWQDFPLFWGNLLTAARAGDKEALDECRLHGLQLIGGELLPLLDGTRR